MKALLTIPLFLALTACPKPLEIVRPAPDKLVCAAEPGRPAGAGEHYTDAEGKARRRVTDEEAAGYMVDLRKTGQDCRDKVQWLRDWFKALP